MDTLETSDIFKGASLISLGAELSGFRRRGRDVTFCLEGDDLKTADIKYRSGQIQVNPLKLKESLNLLRDLIFLKPQRHPTRENRNDRQRSHRAA